MIILKTIVGNLSANVNEITFTDATINSNSIIEVYYNSNDIYTVETWQRENTVGIVTSDHDFPVSVKVLINNVVAFEPYDDTSLVNRIDGLADRIELDEDAISALAGRVGDAEDDIDTLEDAVSNLNTSKQDALIAGENITIENNVISASGGGGFDYTTTEQNLGIKWLDGNDIYRKSYILNPPVSVRYRVFTTMFTDNTIGDFKPIFAISSVDANDTFIPTSIQKSGNSVLGYYNGDWSISNITMWYTKSSN